MTTRKYSSRSQKTTLSAALSSGATTMSVVSATALMGGVTVSAGQTYTVVIDPDTALEEIVDVYSAGGNPVSGNNLTIVRNIDGSTAQAHSAGAEVRHMAIGRDYREANEHSENTTTAHGLTLANVVLTTGTNNVSSGMLQTGAVGTTKIDDTAVTAAKLAPNAVTTAKITDLNVTTGKLADGAVTNTKLADNSVTSAKIVDGTIATDDIADGAVTSAKIADLTIATGDIADGAITSAKIADNTIVNADVNTSAQIAYGKLNLTNSIVNADINASAAIDWSKIAPSATVSTTELGYLDGVTSAIQTQLDSKLATSTAASTYAPLASPALTGVPTAPTAAANTNTTQIATTAYVQTEINDLIASAPGALDTLNELATALGNDANFSTTVTNSLATKLNLSGGTMSGAINMGTSKITNMGTPTASTDAATKGYVDTVTVAPSNLTGPITSVGSATAVASQTGTGSTFVMQNSPTLTTPNLGVATATSINGTTIPSSKTLVATDSTEYVVPSQTGNSGKFLTTNGTTSSWGTAVTPADYNAKGVILVGTGAGTFTAQTVGTNGQYLQADSTQADGVKWATVDALPSQTGNAGRYLTTDGTTASWAVVTTDPTADIFMMMGA